MRFMSFSPVVVATALAVLLSGCSVFRSSTPAAPTTAKKPGVSAPVLPEDQPKVTLVSEQRRLADLFRGTPVVFEMQPDGSLRVDVPLKYSFDDGQTVVKPPLAAVLDRVARSQRTQKTKLRVAAPTDAKSANAQLARERAASTRDYLVAHGVKASRFAAIAPASNGNVEIIVAE
jgi:outer membrane protein OmpA-like peptidoglycan-associated protein